MRASPWLLAARPATLPAAVVPVLVGTAVAVEAAVHEGRSLHLGAFLAALAAAVLIQIGTNLANDVADFHRGADTSERLGPTRVTQAGLLTPRAVTSGTVAAFALAALLGVYLVSIGGWPIALIGVLSILSGLAYTGGPWPLGYHGLGDIFVFVFFGVIGVVFSAYLQTRSIEGRAVLASIPVGFLVTAILVVNNLRDVDGDRLAGKRTLAVRFGRQFARWEYALLVQGAYIVVALIWLSGQLSIPMWIPMLTLPLALALVRVVGSGAEGPELNGVLKRTGQLHLFFGVLFALALAWPAILG